MAQTSFNDPKAVLDGFAIDKGGRGEFLVMLLLTVARNKAVGPPAEHDLPVGSRIIDVAPFLAESPFRTHPTLQALHQDFPDGKMHFNHYVKVHRHEYATIDPESLLLLSSRGAGILCAVVHKAKILKVIPPFPLSRSFLRWPQKNQPFPLQRHEVGFRKSRPDPLARQERFRFHSHTSTCTLQGHGCVQS